MEIPVTAVRAMSCIGGLLEDWIDGGRNFEWLLPKCVVDMLGLVVKLEFYKFEWLLPKCVVDMLGLVVKLEFSVGPQSRFTYCAIRDEGTNMNVYRKRRQFFS